MPASSFDVRCKAVNNLKHCAALQPSHPLAKADALWQLWLQQKAEHRMKRLQELQEEERAAMFREEDGDGPGETSGQGPELLEPQQRLDLEEVRSIDEHFWGACSRTARLVHTCGRAAAFPCTMLAACLGGLRSRMHKAAGACGSAVSRPMGAWFHLLQDQPAGPQDAGAAEDNDDDDLFASLEPSRSGQAATQQQPPASRRAGGPHFGASVFGSITLNMHRAGTGMHVVCTSMASRLERRRSFARPCKRSW